MLPLCPALGVQAGLVWGKGIVELREGRSLGRLPGGGAVIAGLWRQVSRERAGGWARWKEAPCRHQSPPRAWGLAHCPVEG